MVHHVFANRSNAGDWLSALGIQRLLGGLEVTEHLCDDPFVDATLQRLAAAPPDEPIVLGGGGLFMDYFTPFWEGFLPLARKRRFAIWGAGLCDLKSEATRGPASLLREIARHAEVCAVRDEITRDHLGIAAGPVPCPSLVVVQRADGPGSTILHSANLTTVGAPAYRVMRRMAERVAARDGLAYVETSNRHEPDDVAGLQEIVERYADARVVISSRLHGCILALASGRPVVAVSGDRKVEDFMRAAGLGAWVVDQGDLAALPGRLNDLRRQAQPRAFLAGARTANLAVAQRVRSLAPRPSPA